MNSVPIKINPHLLIRNGNFVVLNPYQGYLKSFKRNNSFLFPVWSEWTALSEESLQFTHALSAQEVAGWYKGSIVVRKPLPLDKEPEEEGSPHSDHKSYSRST
jgi:hypothetical protein